MSPMGWRDILGIVKRLSKDCIHASLEAVLLRSFHNKLTTSGEIPLSTKALFLYNLQWGNQNDSCKSAVKICGGNKI